MFLYFSSILFFLNRRVDLDNESLILESHSSPWLDWWWRFCFTPYILGEGFPRIRLEHTLPKHQQDLHSDFMRRHDVLYFEDQLEICWDGPPIYRPPFWVQAVLEGVPQTNLGDENNHHGDYPPTSPGMMLQVRNPFSQPHIDKIVGLPNDFPYDIWVATLTNPGPMFSCFFLGGFSSL